MGFAPMHNAAAYSAVEVMDELIKHAGSSVYFDVTAALHVACDAEMVHRLVQMRADVNGQTDCWKRSTLTRAMCMMMVLQHRFYKVSRGKRISVLMDLSTLICSIPSLSVYPILVFCSHPCHLKLYKSKPKSVNQSIYLYIYIHIYTYNLTQPSQIKSHLIT